MTSSTGDGGGGTGSTAGSTAPSPGSLNRDYEKWKAFQKSFKESQRNTRNLVLPTQISQKPRPGFSSTAKVYANDPVTFEDLERKEEFRHELLNALVDLVPLATAIAGSVGFAPAKRYGKVQRAIIGYGRKYYGRTVKRY